MKTIIIYFLILPFFTLAQNGDCNCETELDFVIDYYQKNLPGFKDNVTAKTEDFYKDLKTNLALEARTVIDKIECFKVLTRYVEFFKDNHSSIRMHIPNVDENDVSQVESFLNSEIFKSREIINLKEEDLVQYPIDEIRGLYQTKDTTYVIAIVPNKTSMRDYVGVIVESKSSLWKRGQVKMELKEIPGTDKFEAFIYLRNHSLQYKNKVTLDLGILAGNWYKTSLKEFVNPSTNATSDFGFNKINDSIGYLRIPSFSSYRTSIIDSLYASAFPQIREIPNLIIDVRNNGGGSDKNVAPLLEFIYTNKIQTDKVDVYVTPDNIKVWEGWYEDAKKDTINFSQSSIKWFKNEIAKQKKAKPYSFIPRSTGGRMSRNFDDNEVKKVVIIQNRACASSCETLLFWAMQSNKTTLVGENSGGYVGYGEIGNVPTPCYGFSLGCTMTRYREQRKYEADGIPPDTYLKMDEDWIDQAINIIEN